MPKLPKLPKPLERNLESIDKVPLLERKREILAGQAKERMEEGRNQHSPEVNLPQATDKTRDSIAAEIGVSGKTYDALRKVSNDGTDELKQAVFCRNLRNKPLDTKREIVKAVTSTGSTGRAQGDVRHHHGLVIRHSRSGECQNPNSNLTATTSTSTTAKSI